MLHRSFKPAKCKTSLKLATSRIKLMKNKKENHLKQLKKELAQLLESGQDQTARIRVEHVVREEKTIAAYELIDIYCELIIARLPIIESQKNCPIDLKEAVTSVVFATPRCADIPELQDVRKHFTAKYGKEFVNAALELRPDCGVSRMIVEKLSANAPDGQTKLRILSAIAEEHNIEWDPKSFGQKESKPYDDLLKGPNQLHSEPPVFQAPPPIVNAPQTPVSYQQNLHSSSSHNVTPSDFNGGQSAPSTVLQPPVRPSGTGYGGMDSRHTHSRDNAFSLGGQNWNMEFKDATAAAQAAAESAERASMAARAAAELSSHEKIMRQHSSESHKSNSNGPRDDRPRKNYDSLSENFVKDADYASPQDRNRKPNIPTKQVDEYVPESHYDADERFYKDDESSAKRYSPSASSRSRKASVSVDDKRSVNTFHEVGKYSQKSSFEDEAVKPDSTASLSGTRVSNQFSGEDRNSYSHASSSDDGDDYNNSPSHHNFVFDDNKDPFDHKESHGETVESGSIGTLGAAFDSYLSDDDDIIKFEKQPLYDEQDSNFYSASITREPSNIFAVNIESVSSLENTSASSEKPLSASRVSAELFSSPQFDETSPKSPSFAHPDDLAAPATFDDSSGPSSDSEDELNKSSFHGKSDADISSFKENDLIRNAADFNKGYGLTGSYFTEKNNSGSSRNQNLLYSSDDREDIEVTDQNKPREEFSLQSRTKFDYDEVPSPSSSFASRNSKVSSNEHTNRLSPQSSRLLAVKEGKDLDDVSTLVPTDTMKNEVFDKSESESGKELNFPTLTGGLRNKGYKTPPYRKNPSGDSLPLKTAAEDVSTYIQNSPATPNSPASPRVEISSLNSGVGSHIKESFNLRTRFKDSDLGTDDFQGEFPQQNLRSKGEDYVRKGNSSSRSGTKNYGLGMDDFEEELPEPKLVNKQERKEDHTKSKFSAPAGFFDPDDDDSEEDLPKQTVTKKVHAASGFSRRTKANPDSETSSYPKSKRGSGASVKPISVSENKSDVLENRPKPRSQSEKHSVIRPTPEEKQKPSAMEQPPSPHKTTKSSVTESSRTSSGEAPSRESSLNKASHVHPKLPDYDSFAAHFQSLRQNRD